jgi:BTB/POZ domain
MQLDLGSFTYEATDIPRADPPKLSWRLTPEESYSDWIIEIQHESVEDDTVEADDQNADHELRSRCDIYHVHRAILANGPRFSQYFKQLFVSNTVENTNQTSFIRLEPVAASVFPAMLDFVYDCDKDVAVKNPKEAVALRHLANYFGIRELFENVNSEFIQQNISIKTAFEYMEEATKYHEISLRDAAIDYIAERVLRTQKATLYRMPIEWFSRLMSKVAVTDKNIALIVGYVKQEPEGLTVEHISQWLERFKSIPPCHSLALFSIAVDFNIEESIKAKCVNGFAKKWRELVRITGQSSSSAEDQQIYSKLPDKEKVRLLEVSLRKAECDFNDLKERLDRSMGRTGLTEA